MEIIPSLILAIALIAREYSHFLAERAAAEERHQLCQRIQAPRETALKEFQETLPPGAPSMPIWTDEEAWAAMGHQQLEISEPLITEPIRETIKNDREGEMQRWREAMK